MATTPIEQARGPVRVGVYTPYGWDEATHMSTTLSEMIMRFGYQVRIRPSNTRIHNTDEHTVHHRWDHEMAERARQPLSEWLKGLSHVVWFELDPVGLQAACAAGVRNVLVALPGLLQTKHVECISQFDDVICPNQMSYDILKKRTFHRKMRVVPWDSAMAIGARRGAFLDKKERRLLVYVDSLTATHVGTAIVDTLEGLMASSPAVAVTVAHSLNWTKRDHKRLLGLDSYYDYRFVTVAQPCALEREAYAQEHDWAWCPVAHDHASAFALEFLSYGLPVIAFDTEPTNEVIVQDYNGALAPCRTHRVLPSGTFRDEVVCADSAQLLSFMRRTLLNSETFFRCYEHEWAELERRKRDFQTAWGELLLRLPQAKAAGRRKVSRAA